MFSFGHVAQSQLPKKALIWVKRCKRRIWHEKRAEINQAIHTGETPAATTCLLTVEFDDQLLINGQLNVFSFGQSDDTSLVIVTIDVKPVGRVLMAGKILR